MSKVACGPLPVGPQPGMKYPQLVEYCGNCSLPFEFCENYPDQDGCRKWLEENMPEQFAALCLGEEDGEGEDGKKRQKRGGKGMMKPKKKEVKMERRGRRGEEKE